MNLDNEDEQILSLTKRFAKHARDFDDLQNEMAGRDTGRMKRFLPDGANSAYSITWSGQYEYIERMQDRLKLVAPATLLIITLMLFMAFSRITEVAIILAALPLCRSPLSVVSG